MKPLLRYTIDISKIDLINMEITALENMISQYELWIEKNGPYEYVQERISHLKNTLAEHLIAREFSKEDARTYGD